MVTRRLEDACWPTAMSALVHWANYQLLDSDVGLEIKVMDLLSAFCLKKEVWGFQSYGFSLGLLASSGIFFFVLSIRFFFFLLVHPKYHLTPLPIKKVDYPCKRGQNWGSYVHNSLPRFNWEYRSCFHT